MFFFKFIISNIMLLSLVYAQEVNLTSTLPYIDIQTQGKTIRIQRIQDKEYKLKNSYTKTSRACPPFCIQKMHPIDGIETIAELDVIDFLKNYAQTNNKMLIDARLTQWYIQGTIPGAINIPFNTLSSQLKSKYIDQILKVFGVTTNNTKRDFSHAMNLIIFDNGPWGQQAVAAMHNLVKLGYPKNKILYYRGGMQYWQILGITTIKPKK